MTRSQMQSAVIQCTILVALDMILNHEIGRNAYESTWEDPVLKNFTTTMKIMNTSGNATTPNNGTLDIKVETEAFYSKHLPINVFVFALCSPLLYYWQIYLERFFPTRPRGVEMDYSKQKEKVDLVDMNDVQEEEVVKRWIAQGKVKRSSISWWNTFVKWVLHVTVGKVFFTYLGYLVDGFVRWHSFTKILRNFPKWVPLITIFSQFLTISPLGALIGFIVVPATKRIVFEAAIDSIWAIFVSSFFRLTIPWLVSTKIVQEFLRNVTESMMKPQPQLGRFGGMDGRLIGGPDEL